MYHRENAVKMNTTPDNVTQRNAWWWGGLLLTPIRWVTGYMFLSAMLRREFYVPAKMDPTSPEYTGHKFATFIPHALGIVKPLLTYFVDHASVLYVIAVTFTMMEALVGLLLITGFMSRLAGLVSVLLSAGILAGAGWIGTTCLDEWQIGSILIATGLTIFLSGSSAFSVDGWLLRRYPMVAEKNWFRWLLSGELAPDQRRRLISMTLAVGVLSAGAMLYSYQAFFNGLWGGMHNYSKQPHLLVTDPLVQTDGKVKVRLYRDGGPDTYGAFVVEVRVQDASGKVLERFEADQLAKVPAGSIDQLHKLQPIKTGPYGLVLPLGAGGVVDLEPPTPASLSHGESVTLTIIDVSGAKWSADTIVK
jgi:uncharacterized membrane protein YphA (DoxX/SURF4 family)